MAKKKTRKKKIKVWCRYCGQFWKSSIKEYATELKKGRIVAKDRRWCKVANRYVDSMDEACDKFNISSLFWCEKDCNQLHVAVCLARRASKKDGCVRCKQGADIERMGG